MILGPIMLLSSIDWQSDDCFGPSTDTRKKTQISAEGREARAYTQQSKFTDAQVRKGGPVAIKAPAVVADCGYDRSRFTCHNDIDSRGPGVFHHIEEKLAHSPKKNMLGFLFQ